MDFIENLRNVHIGTIIREKLKEKSMSVTEFATKINRERSTIYDIFERKSIDIELLVIISKTLDYDFIRSIYYDEETSSTIFIAVKTKEEEITKLNLPEGFFLFYKK
jgi:predicted transcriptional regulator